MKRSDVKELYYITPIANVPSIMNNGILSHELSKKLAHESLAMEEIQSKRENKRIPGARKLHGYANLYFDAHNPMLCKRQNFNDQICVLRIDASVLDLPNVIITDRNAASDYVRFYPEKEESQQQCCVWIVHNGCTTLIILAACVIFLATYLVNG